ncbi:MAG: (Fe-S)-binding protein [Acidiphilium sp.]|nr:(Fe-S)-binding protein [Acidiphilium sp.]MDD4936021.1 (Fe-S)-binding protein [Acidiphilium sp.]
MNPVSPPGPRVALFVTCLVDMYRPSVGFAAINLLEAAGCMVEVPRAQTCCGQPAYNAGDRATARALAAGLLRSLAGYDYVIVPSGSCAGMLREHMPALFDQDPDLRDRAETLAAKCWELTSFLADVMGFSGIATVLLVRATYHDSCAGLRELGVKTQPRALLAKVAGLDLVEMAEPEICCGFGGTFCVKFPDISARMTGDKTADIAASGAEMVLAGDLGCLLNMAGKLSREGRLTADGKPVAVRHVAEVLAGITADLPPIGGVRG